MKMPIHPLLTAICLWLLLLFQTAAAVQDDGYAGLPSTLVSADVLEAKITEARLTPIWRARPRPSSSPSTGRR